MEKQYYVYLHCRPDGEPFYVGKGYGNRSHEFGSGRSKFHKAIVAKHGRERIGIFVFHSVGLTTNRTELALGRRGTRHSFPG